MRGRTNMKTVLTVVLAALFVMAFAYQVSAISASGSTPFTYTGKVLAFDNANKIITVQAGPNDQQSFSLSGRASVMRCSMPFSDLKAGDTVTVNYYDKGGGDLIANQVDVAPSGMTHC